MGAGFPERKESPPCIPQRKERGFKAHFRQMRKLPPIDKRFPVNRPLRPHTQKHPNGYLTPLLKRFLKKTINYEDPETRKIIKGKVKDAVIWRLILNATQGETHAIREIIDRIDGKLKSDPLIDQSTHLHITNFKEFVDSAYRNNGEAIKLRDGEKDTSRLSS